MSDQSFENFLLDTLCRSYESSDWISEQLEQAGHQVAHDFQSISSQRRQAFHSIYQSMLKTLSRNVTININRQTIVPEQIEYHKRFGWVLQAHAENLEPNEAKIFLGKISLLENTLLDMGKRSYISGPATIRGGGELQVGNFCSLAEGLYVTTFNDNHPLRHPAMINFAKNRRLREDGLDLPIDYPELEHKSSVKLGHDVWTGRKVRITGGVSIGNGCVIAEGSLVRKDCEAYGIYAGTPARLIRFRFSEDIIDQLQSIQWWHWPLSKVRDNKGFFETDLTRFDGKLQELIV